MIHFTKKRIQQSKHTTAKNCKLLSYIKKRYKLGAVFLTVGCILLIISCYIFSSGTKKTHIDIHQYSPQPAAFTDDISAAFLSSDNIPDPNNNRELNNSNPLGIYFTSNSEYYINPLLPNLTASDIANDIKITPVIKGTWHKYADEIVFHPAQEWPADTKFSVKISPKLFNPDVKLSTKKISFKTPPITATVDSFNIFPDTDKKKSMVGVAVISFNYPINTKNFKDKVLLKLDNKRLDFTVKFDRFNRTALITTAPISVTNNPQILRLKINRIPARDGDALTKKLTAHTTLESADNFFKITDIDTTIADNYDGNTQQLILINTTAAAQSKTKWDKYINAYLLPLHNTNETDDDDAHQWAADEITPDVLQQSTPITLKQIEFAGTHGVYQYAFSYQVSEPAPRYMYITVQPGILSNNGFELQNTINKVMPVAYPTPIVKIAGSGALLSLAGDKKLGIMARGGVPQAYISLYKIKSSEINHLVSQTYDLFTNNLNFKSYSFGKYDMSSVFQKTIPFANPDITRTNYASVDLGEYLDRTGNDKTGIFIIQTGADKDSVEYGDQRLIMLTDMGIINKKNLDQSSTLFISSLSAGTPVPDVEISVLGRNGNPIWAGQTDEYGHANIPNFAYDEYRNARAPVAIVAKNDNDVTFIPYNADSTLYTEYSKFDIDGEYAYHTSALNAFIFSDRGIYRPGEVATLAGIIKNKSFKSLSGIPIKLELLDARGRTVLTHTISLESDGMFESKYDIPMNAAIGTYTLRISSLNTKNKIQDTIGYTTFQVAEFVPDTMKIKANIQNSPDHGWVTINNLIANISLQNLFGTPATNKRISATATLTPISFTFPEYSGYTFTPNFVSGSGLSNNATTRSQTFSVNLPDVHTDDMGNANLDIQFDSPIPIGTYLLNLTVRGFDTDSGKNVQTTITHHTSDAPYLVGFASTSDLSYINRNTNVDINLIALNSTVVPTDVSDLTIRLIKRENLTSLIKDSNGYYKYQTVSRDKTISTRNLSIPTTGTTIQLDTANSGTYFLQILDSYDNILAHIEYFIASSENDSLTTETNAEMKIKLDKTSYIPGDTINVNITTPYTGAGLLTIERDKVYAYKWFQTKSTSSVQQITVPADFEGTGYVNVAFVRNINSRDIFTSPYTYAVAPFSADISAHKIDVNLTVPKKIDSNQLTIEYQTNQDARIMIFAVDTGILQVARFQLPNPLSHFFKKSALQVYTYQTLSLLLPEFNILREFAKTGGGDFDEFASGINQMLTNPFARKTSKSVAFYSGIISTTANTPGTITFDIPEEFNGNITTFAVATNDTAMGAANAETKVTAPIVISTTLPTFAAPFDTMHIAANISNLTPNSGSDSTVAVFATTTYSLTFKSEQNASLNIPENTEKSITFDLTANGKLGNAELTINANLFGTSNAPIATRRYVSTMSIRPTSTFTTVMHTDTIKSTTHTVRDFQSDMYPEIGATQIFIAQNANPALRPMYEYLSHYEFTCTEQLVSKNIPYVMMPNNKFIGTTHEESIKKVHDAINQLKNRQNDNGSFDLWSGVASNIDVAENAANTAYLTAYVVQFLTMAKNNGFTVPKDMLSRAIDYLRTYAGNTITTPDQAAATAYAIYVITNNGYITTSYISLFEEYANKNIKDWRETIMGAYIATSYKLLKQSDKASDLISKYKASKSNKFIYHSMFSNNVSDDAMYAYLTHQYFKNTVPELSDAIRSYINSGNYSAFTSASIILGFSAAGNTTPDNTNQISVTADDNQLPGQIISNTYIATIPAKTQKITIKCPFCNHKNKTQYTIIQQGFPRNSVPTNNGLEVIREYYNASGNRVTSGTTGDIITVKIFARTRGNQHIPNAVITDLLPGGFIPDSDTITGDPEFAEFREDRVLIYTDISTTTREFTYSVQLGTGGTFAIPPIHAESMYNPQVKSTGVPGTFTVTNATTVK